MNFYSACKATFSPDKSGRMQARNERSLRYISTSISARSGGTYFKISAATTGGFSSLDALPQANKSPTVMKISPIRAKPRDFILRK